MALLILVTNVPGENVDENVATKFVIRNASNPVYEHPIDKEIITERKGQLRIRKAMKRKSLQYSLGESRDVVSRVKGLLDYVS